MPKQVNLLDGRQVVEGGCKHDLVLPPPTKGAKAVVSTGTWLEKRQVKSALEDRKQILQTQRIEKVGSLSHAVWIDDKQKARVTEKRGSYWLHIGHTEFYDLYIYPDEILYLMEMNSLNLTYKEVRMSLQQAYSLFIGKYISLQEHRVFSHLSRQGYKLIRHDPSIEYVYDSDTSDSGGDIFEQSIAVPSTSSTRKERALNEDAKKSGNKEKTDYLKNSSDCVMLNDSSEDDCMEVTTPSMKTKKLEKYESASVSDSDTSSVEADVVCLSSSTLKNQVFSKLPTLNSTMKILFTKAPDTKYIPATIHLHKSNYTLDMDCITGVTNTNQENSVESNTPLLNSNGSSQLYRYNNNGNVSKIYHNIMENYLLQNSSLPNYGLNPRQPLTPGNLPNNRSRNVTLNANIKDVPSTTKQLDEDSLNKSLYKPKSEETGHSSNSIQSIKQNILNKFVTLGSAYSSALAHTKSSEVKEALLSVIIKFNHTFNENYTFVFRGNKCHLIKISAECKAVEVISTDSDSPSSKVLKTESGRLATSTPVKRKRCKTRKRNLQSDSDSNDELDILRGSSIKTISSLLAAKEALESRRTAIEKWGEKGILNQFDGKKIRTKNFDILSLGMKLAEAVRDKMHEFSYRKDCPIETWKQGRQLYKDKITSIVLSDEEISHADDSKGKTTLQKNGSVIPLIQREDCVSVETIMKRLQIIGSPLDCPTDNNVTKVVPKFKISYDVYLPTEKTFRKSERSSPSFSIIILSDESQVPTPQDLSNIRRNLYKGTSFLFAIVSFDTISYTQMETVCLPTMMRTRDNSAQ